MWTLTNDGQLDIRHARKLFFKIIYTMYNSYFYVKTQNDHAYIITTFNCETIIKYKFISISWTNIITSLIFLQKI
jgi:hypothetical protein